MEELFATNKPPLFKVIKYDYRKERMITHFDSIHIDLWDMVQNRDYIPMMTSKTRSLEANEWSSKSSYFC
ncbi:hypothetical protein GmHk_19G054368 [Glycine max]|nr:hypothetical protein GmHk_19G054368 [Glycine max]